MSMNIAFVCTGNTCRSPMAEGIFKKIVKDRNIENVQCRSFGLAAPSYGFANTNAIEAVRKYGVDISNHRTSVPTQYLMYETDLFVCMTKAHAQTLEMYVNYPKKIIVLGDGIPDPYGGDESVYEACAAVIYEKLENLADALFCSVEPMSESQVDGVNNIENKCFSAPWSIDSIREELTNENAHFLVAKSENNVIGYIGVHEIVGEAYIANVAVLPQYRNLGVATKLMEAAERGARERNCIFISLEVRKSNAPAIALYEKRGYKTVGERKNFYANPTEDGLIMTLNFE